MPDSPTLALRPPGVQPALFHMPGDGPPVYTVFDLDGHPHTRTESLGVAATTARFLVTEHGEAWVRAGDWLRILRTDTRALVTASSKAQAAVDHLNTLAGRAVETTEPNEETAA